MPEDKKSLTPQQLKAIGHMMNAPTLGAAAKLAGVNEKTLWRWQQDPLFAAELRRVEAGVMRDSVRMLTGAMALASVTVKAIMASKESTTAEKLRAASVVLASVTSLRVTVDTETRLQELEAAVAGAHNDH